MGLVYNKDLEKIKEYDMRFTCGVGGDDDDGSNISKSLKEGDK